MNTVEIYTDGACKGNPGPGGWGVLLRSPSGQEKELFGGELETTNNRMELTAVIRALEALKAAGAEDILVICGGVIPQQDYQYLYDHGVKAIFGPGTNIPDAARQILGMIRAAPS